MDVSADSPYGRLYESARNYYGPTKARLAGKNYKHLLEEYVDNEAVLDNMLVLFKALHAAEPTRSHEEIGMPFVKKFMSSFMIRYFSDCVFTDFEMPVAAGFGLACKGLVYEFERIVAALAQNKMCSFQDFWKLLGAYHCLFDDWQRLLRGRLPLRIQSQLVVTWRAIRGAENFPEYQQNIEKLLERVENLRKSLVAAEKGNRVRLHNVETFIRLETEMDVQQPGAPAVSRLARLLKISIASVDRKLRRFESHPMFEDRTMKYREELKNRLASLQETDGGEAAVADMHTYLRLEREMFGTGSSVEGHMLEFSGIGDEAF